MKLRHILACASTAVALSLVSGCASAYEGDPYAYYMNAHPNIEAADANAAMAIERMQAAQHANDYHLGGHAGRAIALLQEARAEMTAAAVSASR